MTDLVEDVRRGIAKFEHETACGLIAVETLAVQREVLVKLCDEIERLRQAVLAEREACLEIAYEADRGGRAIQVIKDAIRARGEK